MQLCNNKGFFVSLKGTPVIHCRMVNSILESPIAWITYYFLANLGLTIHNKWVLNKLHFDFPWLLTATHIGISGIGAAIAMWYSGLTLSSIHSRELLVLVLFSLLYTINIAISNVSLNYVTLSFHQIVRSLTPAFTIVLEAIWLHKFHRPSMYVSLIPVRFI